MDKIVIFFPFVAIKNVIVIQFVKHQVVHNRWVSEWALREYLNSES